jgi:predicted P-loop ATPase
MDPGCQFDTALTLVGTAGGERKSSFFNVMAGDDFYRSSLARIGDQQAVGMNMRGMWLVELGELSSLRTTDRDSFAEFITRRREQFNAKYERCEAREPRQCGICATTNTEQFLDAFDPAVRRRFWPVYVGKRIDIRWVQEHRDEMWAEAYAAFKAGEPWWYEDEAVLEESKERFVAASPTEEKLLEFLQNDSQRASIEGKNATSIAQIALGLQGTVSASIRQQVAHILNKYAGEYDITRQRKRGLTTYLFGSKK